eukprot:scaffold60627_cov37-Tisochrysis_lutea.AAC.1
MGRGATKGKGRGLVASSLHAAGAKEPVVFGESTARTVVAVFFYEIARERTPLGPKAMGKTNDQGTVPANAQKDATTAQQPEHGAHSSDRATATTTCPACE